MLIAFGIIRLADGNLLYASRFYGTEHHRAGNIFMTSRDEGRTWQFADDYIPKTLQPLEFHPSGSGGNPQMYFTPDGRLIHITSQGWAGDPLQGGFFLCHFQGIRVEDQKPVDKNGTGIVVIDINPMTRIDEIYIAKIVIQETKGVDLPKENEGRHTFSMDGTRVTTAYHQTGSPASLKVKLVLANKNNPYRPIFKPEIVIGRH